MLDLELSLSVNHTRVVDSVRTHVSDDFQRVLDRDPKGELTVHGGAVLVSFVRIALLSFPWLEQMGGFVMSKCVRTQSNSIVQRSCRYSSSCRLKRPAEPAIRNRHALQLRKKFLGFSTLCVQVMQLRYTPSLCMSRLLLLWHFDTRALATMRKPKRWMPRVDSIVRC